MFSSNFWVQFAASILQLKREMKGLEARFHQIMCSRTGEFVYHANTRRRALGGETGRGEPGCRSWYSRYGTGWSGFAVVRGARPFFLRGMEVCPFVWSAISGRTREKMDLILKETNLSGLNMLTQKIKGFSETGGDCGFWYRRGGWEPCLRLLGGDADSQILVRCVIKSHYSFQYGRMFMLQRLGCSPVCSTLRNISTK